MKPVLFFYGASDRNRDMLYATKYYSSSPFMLVVSKDFKFMIVDKLEFPKANKEASVTEVSTFEYYLPFKDYVSLANKTNSHPSKMGYVSEVARIFLKEKNFKQITVSPDFPLKIAQNLKWYGFSVKIEESLPLFKQRLIKTPDELKAIQESISASEAVLAEVVNIIKSAEVRNNVLYHEGSPLTSDFLRKFIRLNLYKNDFVSPSPICASGLDTAQPHSEGSNVLRVNSPILLDIFPRSIVSNYFSDMTRTFVRGKASEDLKKMFDAVIDAQQLAFSMIKDNVKVSSVYLAVMDLFKSRGFRTDDNKSFGFMHSLGHGVGLDVHEPPNISDNESVFKSGNVVTIEPGLYYPTIGGVRIEDMILVKEDGCEILTSFSKEFEL